MSRLVRRLVIAAMGLAASIAGCTPEDSDAQRAQATGALTATVASPLPKGLVCGMSYVQATDQWVFTAPSGVVGVMYNNDLLGAGFGPGVTLNSRPSVTNVTSHAAFLGACNNVPTVRNCYAHNATTWSLDPSAWFCQADQFPQAGYRLHGAADSDDAYHFWFKSTGGLVPGGFTAPGPWGFIYQAYGGTADVPAATGSTGSDRFVLPKGTACGFSHTTNGATVQTGITDLAPGCMGYDPLSADASLRCPSGWVSRYAFDMSSGNGNKDCSLGLSTQPDCGFWGWCEYQDPHNLCDGKCLADAVTSGVTVNVQSDVDASGFAWCTRSDSHDWPGCTCYGGSLSSHFDTGRGWNEGLSWCGNFQVTRDNMPLSGLYSNIPQYCSQLTTTCNFWNAVPNGSVAPLAPNTDGGFCEQPCLGYVGCFADNPSRVLPYSAGSGYTIETCEQAAYNLGFAYAGLEYGGQCFLGNAVDGLPQIGQSPNCNMTCSAKTSEFCGGNWALSVYHVAAPPAPVINLAARGSAVSAAPSSIFIDWAVPPGIPTGYQPSSFFVYRNGIRIASTTSIYGFSDYNVPDGSYSYTVTAVNAAGEGKAAGPVTAQAEHCDSVICATGCCAANRCYTPANSPSFGCASNGNACGAACPAGWVCSNGACTAPCTRIPQSTACSGMGCDSASDGCGGSYNCGTCPLGTTCGKCDTGVCYKSTAACP